MKQNKKIPPLFDENEKLVTTIAGKLQIMTKKLEKEFYQKPDNNPYPAISAELWRKQNPYPQHVPIALQQQRGESRLRKYMMQEMGTAAIITSPITKIELKTAIESIQNRKSVGTDEIAAETLKQNQGWVIPIFEIILCNCQRRNKLPKSWIKGIVVFIPKTRTRAEYKT